MAAEGSTPTAAQALQGQLQTTLQGTYTVERELGGGGMSRVFVANELRLNRRVVVKVLSPELAAGISAERFEREIQLAASLQQANIVPVLTAGDTGGIPYFTMPFVEGESLRARLGQGSLLPIAEVVGILRDVARALAYAHDRGVVHRDIKPDNVLLSGGTAVVTDFGIAKALSASRQESSSETLTQLGTSIGTPAYMSPEQAAGDPNIDHRADIYAFGCMAYELLAGRSPFSGRTPQRILAAHMSEAPEPVTALRSDTPAAMSALVMGCLAKDPEARPQRAADLARLLDNITSGGGMPALPAVLLGGRAMFVRALLYYAAAFILVAALARAAIVTIGLPSWTFTGALIVMALGLPVILFTAFVQRTTRHAYTATGAQGTLATLAVKASPVMSWRRTAFGGAYALGGFALLVGGFMVLRALGIGPAGSLLAAGKLSEQDQILVADFKATGADSASGGALAELMRSSLQQSHAVRLMPASSVAGALGRMQRPVDSHIDLALAQELAKREGVKAIVTGEATPLGGGTLITVRLLAAETGDVLWSSHRSVTSAAEFVPAMDALARDLRAKIGESLRAVQGAPALARVSTSSILALQKFTEGARATDVEGDYDKAIRLLGEAIAIDSTFAMAYRKLYLASANAGVPASRASEILEKAMRYLDHLPEAERLALLAAYHEAPTKHADRGKSVAAYEELFRRFPEWKVIITANNLGNRYLGRQDFAKAESVYTDAIRHTPDERQPHLGLLVALGAQGKLVEMRQRIETTRPLLPGEVLLDFREAQAFYATGQFDSARMGYTKAATGTSLRWSAAAHNALASMALTEGRLGEAKRERAAGGEVSARMGEAPSAAADSLFWVRVALRVKNRPEEALRILGNTFGTARSGNRPFLTLAQLYAMAGKPERARAELGQYDLAETDSAWRRQDALARHLTMGWILTSEKKYREAIAEFRASDRLPDGPATGCTVCIDAELAQVFDLAGEPDSAIAYLEHMHNTLNWFRISEDPLERAGSLRHLGELYEAKGNYAKAIASYQQFVDLWKNADLELQPWVTEIRQRIGRLKSSEKP